MKYKALIFDLDGTAVPSEMNGMPSKAVIKAVQKAKKTLKVSTASGRSVQNCRDIWKVLDIEDPCIISGGSQIINPKTEEIVWQEHLPEGSLPLISKISGSHGLDLAINGVFFKKGSVLPQKATIAVVIAAKKDLASSLSETFSQIPNLAVHILPTWWGGDEARDIHLTHTLATKKHAIKKLLEILGVTKEEAIGVGDNNNDMPLFESVGYKVAMGNAQEVLKQAADYIADTFDNDGLAKFIEEKILKQF